MNQKYPKKTISEFFGNGVLFSGEILGSFLLTPPNSRSSKFNSLPPHPPGRSELVSGWLKFTRAPELKHYSDYCFAYPLWCVWGGGLNQWGRGINRKDPNFNYSEEFGTRKIGGGYHKFRLNGSEGFNKIFGVGILENLLAARRFYQ